MKIQKRNTSRILAACIAIAVLIISTIWVLSKLDPFPIILTKRLHENAAFLALSICQTNECKSHLGWGTKELPIDASEQMLQRWCVEVFYTENQMNGNAAVEIILIDRDDDNPGNWKIVNTEYGANCSVMK